MVGKTGDGKFKLRDIVNAALRLPGVNVERGRNHPYLLKYQGAEVGNCALAKTTNTDKHLIPWFKKVTGYDKVAIYEAFKTGEWPYRKAITMV